MILFMALSCSGAFADTEAGSVHASYSFEPNLIDPGETFTITVHIVKGEMEVKGKVTTLLPEGFTANEIETEGGIFSFENRMATISWKNLPVPNEFYVSFEVETSEDATGSYSISGRFSYFEDDQMKLVNIPAERVVIGKELGGNVITIKGEGDGDEIRTILPSDSADNTATSAAEIREAAGVSTVGSSEEEKPVEEKPEVYYRLQIFTDTKEIDLEKYKKKNKIDEDIYVIKDRTKRIYAIGQFQSYKEANAYKREMAGKKYVKTALVVGDQHGQYLSASKVKKLLGE